MAEQKKTYEARYMQRYRRQNPEKQEQWRINSEIRHLRKAGYTVTKQRRKQPEELSLEELESHVSQELQKRRDRKREWREKNREHLRQYHRQYQREHPEKVAISPERARAYKAKWREKHREEIREYSRKYYQEHPDQMREYRKNWRKKNPDYEKRRWARYKAALERARKEQKERIQRDIQEAREKKGGECR